MQLIVRFRRSLLGIPPSWRICYCEKKMRSMSLLTMDLQLIHRVEAVKQNAPFLACRHEHRLRCLLEHCEQPSRLLMNHNERILQVNMKKIVDRKQHSQNGENKISVTHPVSLFRHQNLRGDRCFPTNH